MINKTYLKYNYALPTNVYYLSYECSICFGSFIENYYKDPLKSTYIKSINNCYKNETKTERYEKN